MRPPSPSLARIFASPRGARLLFIFLTLAGLLVFAASPTLKRKLGLNQFDLWFADSYAVLAASDAHRTGLDPTTTNPLDLLHRPHSYTDWWYALGPLGLTRDHNFLVGASWVVAFLAVTWLTLRPTTLRATFLFAALALSPPVLLAVNRANNDLVIFTLLGLAVLVLHPRRTGSWLPALALIALATGLKFYPVVAAIVFFLLRPTRLLLLSSLTSAAVLVLVLLDIWPTLGRGQFALPPTPYTFGAPTLFRDLGYQGGGTLLLAVIIIGTTGFILTRARLTTGLADPPHAPDSLSVAGSKDFLARALFLLGATTLLACFLAGVSYGYRWIFALWLAPWLHLTSFDHSLTPARRRLALVSGGLLLVLSWADGLFCLGTNLLIGPLPAAQLKAWQHTWRLVTQPLAWIFFGLLAGWIADAVLHAIDALRTSPKANGADRSLPA